MAKQQQYDPETGEYVFIEQEAGDISAEDRDEILTQELTPFESARLTEKGRPVNEVAPIAVKDDFVALPKAKGIGTYNPYKGVFEELDEYEEPEGELK